MNDPQITDKVTLMVPVTTDDRIAHIRQSWSLYECAFPSNERRCFEKYVTLCERDPDFHPGLIYTENQWIGLMWFWDFEKSAYLEHFAICPDYRNGGLGGLALDLFLRRFGTIILEVEPPRTPLTTRRVHFYQRHGLILTDDVYTHPGYETPDTPYELNLMSTTEGWPRDKIDRFFDFLFARVIQKERGRIARP